MEKKEIRIINLSKEYKKGTKVLDDINLVFDSGKFYAIMGRSGAGKSTLLNIIGTIDNATNGQVLIRDVEITSMTEKEKAEFRNKILGFVFQGFYLNPYLSALENVIVPMRINENIQPSERKDKAMELLQQFGVDHLAKALPFQMSGGEQQRVCIARALANNPEIILADEPTGNLDENNEKIVFGYLKKLAEDGYTVIVVSHNDAVKEYADEIVMM